MISRKLLPTLLGVALVLLLAVLRLGDPLPVATIRDMGFDLYQHLQPRAGDDSPVRVVDIDEASLATYGQWPWPRSQLATLTDRLTELGAASIGYDVLFAEPDRMSAGNDAQFAASLGRSNTVLGFSLAAQRAAARHSAQRRASPSRAAIRPRRCRRSPGRWRRCRRSPMRRRGSAASASAVSMRRARCAACRCCGATGRGSIRRFRSRRCVLRWGSTRWWRWATPATGRRSTGCASATSRCPPRQTAISFSTTNRPNPKQVISAAAILGPDYASLAPDVQGRIILVGTSASGLLDLHSTPLSLNIAGRADPRRRHRPDRQRSVSVARRLAAGARDPGVRRLRADCWCSWCCVSARWRGCWLPRRCWWRSVPCRGWRSRRAAG